MHSLKKYFPNLLGTVDLPSNKIVNRDGGRISILLTKREAESLSLELEMLLQEATRDGQEDKS